MENCRSGWRGTGGGSRPRCVPGLPSSSAARILAFRVEEVFLGVLVDTERDHVQGLRKGDLLDAAHGILQRGQPKMMAQDRIGGLPADALDGGLGKISLGYWFVSLAFQISQDGFRRLAAVKGPFEETQRPGADADRRGAAKSEAHPGGVQVGSRLGKLAQQALARLRGQAV